MKIAILNISIGDYACFWDEFYITAKRNFLIDCKKEFYVFTDSEDIVDSEDIHKVFQKDMGWPLNTMKRFHLFRELKEELKDFNYIFFVNGNAKFEYPITSGIILKDKDIIAVEHPAFHYKKIQNAPFENRKESRAFVPDERKRVYVQGAFFGGRYNAFFKMIEELDDLTEKDLKENIIALWHDESFLNYYVAYHDNIQVLGWQYLKFEECIQPYKPVIVLRDKRKYLNNRNGRYFNENFKVKRFLMFLRNCKWRLLIVLGVYRHYSILDKASNYCDLNVLKERIKGNT